MNTGALHAPLCLQLISPPPYSPPITKAAFLRPGTTMTHSAFSHSSWGISLSGTAWISFSTVAASCTRLASLVDRSAARAEHAKTPTNRAPNTAHFIAQSSAKIRPLLTEQEHYQAVLVIPFAARDFPWHQAHP